MRLKVILAFGNYRKGDIIPDCGGGVAREYIRRGFCIADDGSAPVNRGILSLPMKRGRRPNKAA
jgi:hypothetical protein